VIASIKPVDFVVYDGYGLAIGKSGPWIGHGGAVPGFNAWIGRDPEERNTVVILTSMQVAASPQGEKAFPAFELLPAVTTALYG
jgi:D-alanyl-D-alanine carboxypeptidase